jgi:drug/metabolite transporter (DMT)-like permease
VSRSKWLYLIALSLIWGSSFILMKRALQYFTPGQVAALRMIIACSVSFPFVARQLRTVQRSRIRYIAIVGICGSGLPALLFTTAQATINSSLAGILNSLTPVFTLLIGALFFRTRFSTLQIAGVLSGLAGAAALILITADGNVAFDIHGLLIVLATALYGISVNTIKAFLSDIHSVVISGISLLFPAIPYGVYLFTTDFLHRLDVVPGAWAGIGYTATLAFFGTAISNILYFRMVKIASPLFASAVTYLIPVVALMWGLLDSERLSILHIPAMAAILGGIAMISWHGYRNRKPAVSSEPAAHEQQ